MHICLSCKSRVFSNRAVFPLHTIGKVVVSNTDHSTYTVIEPKNGDFEVDFQLTGTLTDHLKFHFFTSDKVPVLIAAGGVDMNALDGKHLMQCNFQKIHVSLEIKSQCEITENLPKSVLHKADKMMAMICEYTDYVDDFIKHKLIVEHDNGGSMFSKVLAVHNMDSQPTSHLHYQDDFMPTPYTSERFLRSGITMACLVETLHLQRMSVEKVMQLPDDSMQFTRFVSLVCEACMRSAKVCPYTPDMNVGEALDSNGNYVLIPGESFKRPFAEPFCGALHTLQTDDCEGQAVWMLQLFWSFAHMRDCQMDELFPDSLFELSLEDKEKLYELAMRIGGLVRSEKIECKVTLVSSASAALGQQPAQIGGHATTVLVNSLGKHQILMEGTNCICPDLHHRDVKIHNQCVGLSTIANQLTMKMLGENRESPDFRAMIHLDMSGNLPFYRSAFTQGNMLLATKQDRKYGIHVRDINDEEIRAHVNLEIDRKMEAKISEYVGARQIEIHPPLTSVENVRQAIEHWSKLKLNTDMADRPCMPCVYTHAVLDPSARQAELEATQNRCDEWNQKNAHLGFAKAFTAFDSVYHALYLYTDNLQPLCDWIEAK